MQGQVSGGSFINVRFSYRDLPIRYSYRAFHRGFTVADFAGFEVSGFSGTRLSEEGGFSRRGRFQGRFSVGVIFMEWLFSSG